jgi:hypothetical protein
MAQGWYLLDFREEYLFSFLPLMTVSHPVSFAWCFGVGCFISIENWGDRSHGATEWELELEKKGIMHRESICFFF